MGRTLKIKNDLTGQRFGMAYVKEMIEPKKCRERCYNCVCDCGKEFVRSHSSLLDSKKNNRVTNCGCYSLQYLTSGDSARCTKAGKNRKNAFVNGSNIQMTLREGTITTNTSGCQGVSFDKSTHKWHTYVGYQNYRANLGYFEDKEDAIRIRRLAQEAIINNEFEDFFFQLRGHKLGEKSQKYFKKK